MPCIGNTLDLEIEAMSGQIMVLDSWAKWPGAVDSQVQWLGSCPEHSRALFKAEKQVRA